MGDAADDLRHYEALRHISGGDDGLDECVRTVRLTLVVKTDAPLEWLRKPHEYSQLIIGDEEDGYCADVIDAHAEVVDGG